MPRGRWRPNADCQTRIVAEEGLGRSSMRGCSLADTPDHGERGRADDNQVFWNHV
jgi:hypothetical protein